MISRADSASKPSPTCSRCGGLTYDDPHLVGFSRRCRTCGRAQELSPGGAPHQPTEATASEDDGMVTRRRRNQGLSQNLACTRFPIYLHPRIPKVAGSIEWTATPPKSYRLTVAVYHHVYGRERRRIWHVETWPDLTCLELTAPEISQFKALVLNQMSNIWGQRTVVKSPWWLEPWGESLRWA